MSAASRLRGIAAAWVAVALMAPVACAHDEDGMAWIVLHPGGNSTSGSGDISDWKAIGKLSKTTKKTVLYARLDQKRFLIDDPAVITRIDQLMEPQEKFSKEQEALGKESERLSAVSEKLDDQESVLDERKDEIVEELERLQERYAEVATSSSASDQAREDLRKRRAALRVELDRIGDQLDELGEKMDALEAEEAKLDDRQEAVDREHERLFKIAEDQVRVLLKDAVARGIAAPLPR